jgi:hypothetical protein
MKKECIFVEAQQRTSHILLNGCTEGLPDFSWYMIPKMKKCTK